MTPRVVETAAVLLIGNELLSGKVHESNLIELAKMLRALGIQLRRVLIVPDEPDVIATEAVELSRKHDVVFTSGGVGPTHDDVTIESIAQGFGVEARIHPAIADLLRNAYGERCTDDHLRMALVPEGAELAVTDDVNWPTVVMKNIWILPGVPEIFRMKLAVVRELLRGPVPFVSRSVFTRLDEATLKPLLDTVVREHPSVDVGSYPKWFDATYKTKITFDGRDSSAVERAVESFVATVPEDGVVRVE